MARNPETSERDKWRGEYLKESGNESSEAGDESLPEGQASEARKAYPKLLREEIVFGPDPFERTSDEIILDSGCNNVNDNL